MRDELFGELKKNFPTFFSEIKTVECGNGWYDLIFNLSQNLYELTKSHNLFVGELYYSQIKNKFGSLRIYTDKSNVPINYNSKFEKQYNLLISLAEEESLVVCENCGDSKPKEKSGWFSICNKCRKKR